MLLTPIPLPPEPAKEAALYAEHGRVERVIALLAEVRRAFACELPLNGRALDDLDRVRADLTDARDKLEIQIDALEWAKAALVESCDGAV
jgi:hypothetical protein